jgi:acetylxylan esterase
MYISTSTLGGLATILATANGALTRVNDFGSNPTNIQMNINVPSKLATKPAIILAVRPPYSIVPPSRY